MYEQRWQVRRHISTIFFGSSPNALSLFSSRQSGLSPRVSTRFLDRYDPLRVRVKIAVTSRAMVQWISAEMYAELMLVAKKSTLVIMRPNAEIYTNPEERFAVGWASF